MIFIRRINGVSMIPKLRPGAVVVGSTNGKWQAGSIVFANAYGREVVKRIVKIDGDRVWLEGDNPPVSTDSRQYGSLPKSAIIGVMKYSLPSSTPAPKLRHPKGEYMGWVSAIVIMFFAVVHLFRIDTFVPELQMVFGFNRVVVPLLIIASLIVCAEVFALPFLFRMRLSPLARYISGAFSVLVPLFWLLVSIWTLNQGISTAQLGEFVSLPSTWLLIIVNTIWLIFACLTIWALGYDEKFRGLRLSNR